jgi:hypothetical protein
MRGVCFQDGRMCVLVPIPQLSEQGLSCSSGSLTSSQGQDFLPLQPWLLRARWKPSMALVPPLPHTMWSRISPCPQLGTWPESIGNQGTARIFLSVWQEANRSPLLPTQIRS